MSYTVQAAKAELEGMLHGTTNNQITNLDGLMYRAARQLLLDIDPAETKRIVAMSTPIYDRIYDYAVPVDLKGNRIIDIFPPYNRKSGDDATQRYNRPFDIATYQNVAAQFTVIHNTGVKTIRINNDNGPAPLLLDAADDSSDWSATGTASNLQTDTVNYVSNGASISFDLSTGVNPQTGGLESTLSSAVDLSDHLNQSTLFFYVYFPTASDITSVTLKWGSSSSAYYSRVITTTQQGTAFANGWNLLGAAWLGATVTGSPDASAIDYVAVSVIYNGTAQTAVRIDAIQSILGRLMNMEYYSKYLFSSSTGIFQETIDDDSNLVNLDVESYNLWLWIVAAFAVQQQSGQNSVFDNNYFWSKYLEAKKKYTALYKSEVIKPVENYYPFKKAGYTQYLGRKW